MPVPSPPSPNPLPASRSWPGFVRWALPGYLGAGLGALALAPVSRTVLLDGLNLAVFLQAGIHMLLRSKREVSAALGWRLLGLGMLAQSGAQGWATLSILTTRRDPGFPSWGDTASLLSLGLVIAALLAWPLASASGSERLRKGLDGLGVATSVFFLSWFFALGPMFKTSTVPTPALLFWMAFFLAVAMILGIGAYLGARQPDRLRGPLGWLLAAFCISMIGVTLQIPLGLAGRYFTGHPLDLMVLLAGMVILLVPLAPQPLEPGTTPANEIQDRSISAILLPILPAATILSLAFGALLLDPGRLDAPTIGTGILLAAMALFRGLLVLRDFQRLSAHLEARVQERTRDLEAAQDLLLRTERLNSMAALGAGIAHDLKNLLGIIRLNAELLVEARTAPDPVLERHAAHLTDATDRATGLASNLMALGRGLTDPAEEVDLIERIQHLWILLRATLPSSIHFDVSLPSRPAFLHCQPGRVDQLVVNLVLNARDAMPEGGTLSLRVALVEESGAPLAELTIADTGTGIPEELHGRVFEPFFTTKPLGRGTGLGLASVVQTVSELRGTLSLASERGLGTTFTLRLPARI